jgi:ribosome-associated protein
VIPITADAESRTTAQRIASIIDDKKGEHITLLDVSDLLQITEIFVIATGNSRRQVLTLTEELEVQLKHEGRPPLRVEGREEALWVLLDFGDVVVHLFQTDPRRYYDLERLWGDAPRLEWEPAVSDAQ